VNVFVVAEEWGAEPELESMITEAIPSLEEEEKKVPLRRRRKIPPKVVRDEETELSDNIIRQALMDTGDIEAPRPAGMGTNKLN
jgi:hypothetical protein